MIAINKPEKQGYVLPAGGSFTPDEIKSRQRIAEHLRKGLADRTPQNVGEGIRAIANALVARGIDRSTPALKPDDGRTPAPKPLPAYRNGTPFHPGGYALVGEDGPEVVDLPRGAKVFPNERNRQTGDDLLSPPPSGYTAKDAQAMRRAVSRAMREREARDLSPQDQQVYEQSLSDGLSPDEALRPDGYDPHEMLDIRHESSLHGAGGNQHVIGQSADDRISSMPEGVDFSTATGLRGFGAQLANTLSDAVGMGLVDRNNETATQAMTNLANRTMVDLASGVAGRPSNYLLEQFEQLVARPNSIWMGEGRMEERLNQTRAMIGSAIQENQQILDAESISNSTRSEAAENIERLSRLLSDYDDVIGSFGQSQNQDDAQMQTTTNGVQWRVVQ